MFHISEDEVSAWEDRINDQRYRTKLKTFQDEIFDLFETYRNRTEGRLIRFVCPRTDLKSLKSIIKKIQRRRKEGEEDYNFDKLDDVSGIKVLCPYPSSAEEVIRWMFTQSYFTLQPKTRDEALKSNKYGYRGWHFVAEPSAAVIRLKPLLIGAKCEIQIKTMLQEAWDAQTHDISYKKEELISTELLDHIKSQSTILSAVDEQSEIIRKLIQRVDEEEEEHMKVAAKTLFSLAIPIGLPAYLKEHCNIELQPYQEIFPLSREKLEEINRFISCYRQKNGLSKGLVSFVTFIALCQKDIEQEELAISVAREYAGTHPEDPLAEDALAETSWALNHLDTAIIHGKKAIDKARKSEFDLDNFQNNLCYWVAEAVRARKDVKQDRKKQILKLSESLSEKHPNKPKFLDTTAFVKIVLGETKEEIEDGLSLTRKARVLAEQDDNEIIKSLAYSFGERHEKLAFLRICELH